MLHEWGAEWHPTTDATGSFSRPGVFVWNDDTGPGTLAAEDPDSEEWCDTVSLEIVRGHPFTDVKYCSRWEREIAWLWQSGITAGCTSSLYCRDGAVTRGQMASFLARALELPPAGRDYFTDDEASRHEGTSTASGWWGLHPGARLPPSARRAQ